MSDETFIVVLSSRGGKRVGKRHNLHVPLNLAIGEYGRLSNRALNDAIKDLRHEQMRRAGELFDGQEAQRTRWSWKDTQSYGEDR